MGNNPGRQGREAGRKRLVLAPVGLAGWWLAVAVLVLGFVLVPVPSPLFRDDYSLVVADRGGNPLRVYLNSREQWHLPPDPKLKLSPELIATILFYEDRGYFHHPGVQFGSLLRAFWQNLTSGTVVSGASTITMQAARMADPKARTVFAKLLEIVQAIKINLFYSKDEVLRAYLDNAPYGKNIVGIQAASARYFGKTPERLSWAEAAVLALLPNAPGIITPEGNPEALRAKRDALLGRMRDAGVLPQDAWQLAILEPLPRSERPFAFSAPHFAEHVRRSGARSRVQTTLDANLQSQIEDLVGRYSRQLALFGVRNAAVLVADTQSREILAWVGSGDFLDAQSSGQNDGVLAARSSGSVLKPFLYALCIDDGLLSPESRLVDTPLSFGAFTPSNADKSNAGLVSLKDALVRSLNIPAVSMLKRYGLLPFYRFLMDAGVTTLFRRPEDYGLPLIIGGAEVRLLDLAALFAGLGNGGRFAPLSWKKAPMQNSPAGARATADRREGVQLISPGAAWLVLDMLKDLERPGIEGYRELFADNRPLAWKTGTSYGNRDAWSVGVSPDFTIAVWTGNFSGEENRNLRSTTLAAPLLFDVFNTLSRGRESGWFVKPEDGLSQVAVCTDTGYRAGPFCPNSRLVDVPLRAKPLIQCPWHRRIFVDDAARHEVCSSCWTPGHYHEESRLVYPPDVVTFLRKRGLSPPPIPTHLPGCPLVAQGDSLTIVYPKEGTRVWLPREIDGTLQKLTLTAAHREEGRVIFWYLDEVYLGQTEGSHVLAVQPSKGSHVLSVIDDRGLTQKVHFEVDRAE